MPPVKPWEVARLVDGSLEPLETPGITVSTPGIYRGQSDGTATLRVGFQSGNGRWLRPILSGAKGDGNFMHVETGVDR